MLRRGTVVCLRSSEMVLGLTVPSVGAVRVDANGWFGEIRKVHHRKMGE